MITILPPPRSSWVLALLGDLTELTGGRAFTIDNPNDLADVATKMWYRVAQPICHRIPSKEQRS